MKPAFPTVVYLMPNCWKLLAAKSAMPQAIPPIQRSRVLYGEDVVVDVEGSAAAEAVSLERFKRKITGTRTAAPIRERTPLKKKDLIFHAYTLGDKGDSPDGSGQKQAERIFQRHFLCVHDKRILSRIMWSKRYIRKRPLQIASRGIFMICGSPNSSSMNPSASW